MSGDINKYHKELFEVLSKLSTPEECELFLRDLCTIKELDAMAGRIQAAKLLLSGETYEKIIAKTDISSATLSRVSKCVKYGDGYKKFL
ncbi:MAG: TrpR-related protein YerC/YecD [Clostridiales bacterium]|nr:TrpR-related protein YerC/YecD [Clostridiales bacterium]